MRIGIDARRVLNPDKGEGAGVAHYTHHLIQALSAMDQHNEYVLFFDKEAENLFRFEHGNVVVRRFPFIEYSKFLPESYSQLLVSAFLKSQNLDVYHASTWNFPLPYRGPSVITVSTTAMFRHPEWLAPSRAQTMRQNAEQIFSRVSQIITESEFTHQDLAALFPHIAHKIVTIHNGVELAPLMTTRELLKEKYEIPDEYLFFVGTIAPRKNLHTVMDAVQILKKRDAQYANLKLVIAGRDGIDGSYVSEIKNRIRHQGEDFQYLGFVDAADRDGLMRNSLAFVCPSLYEGFGHSVLEAFSLNVPVITSNRAALPELAQGAAMIVDPSEPEAIAEGIDMMLHDDVLRARLLAAASRRAESYTWRETARKTLDVYQWVHHQALAKEADRLTSAPVW